MSEIKLSWNTHADAALKYQSWEMDCSSFIKKSGGAYLAFPVLCATKHPPAVVDPFVCSIPNSNLPGQYAHLTEPRKALYNTEHNAYKATVKVADEARERHAKIVNAVISWIEDSFDNESTCRKNRSRSG
jgi:hypothetical protein